MKETKKEEEEEEETELERMDTSEPPAEETPKGRKKEVKEEEEDVKKTPKAAKKEPAPEVATPSDAELPEFDPDRFTPGYVPTTVKKGKNTENIRLIDNYATLCCRR